MLVRVPDYFDKFTCFFVVEIGNIYIRCLIENLSSTFSAFYSKIFD